MIRCAITRNCVRSPLCSTAFITPRKQPEQLSMLQYTCHHSPHAQATRMPIASAICSLRSLTHGLDGLREARSPVLVRHWSSSFTPDVHYYRRLLSSISSSSSSARERYPTEPVRAHLWQRIAKFVLKLAAGLVLMSVTIITLLPAIISTTTGLHATLAVANSFLPGQIAIEKVSVPSQSRLSWCPLPVMLPMHGSSISVCDITPAADQP